jgi:hypothetical protein
MTNVLFSSTGDTIACNDLVGWTDKGCSYVGRVVSQLGHIVKVYDCIYNQHFYPTIKQVSKL